MTDATEGTIKKSAFRVTISDEFRWSFSGPEYRRKVEREIVHPVPLLTRVKFWFVKKAYYFATESKFYVGGYEDGFLEPPEPPRVEYVYAETEDEWRDRCRGLDRKQHGATWPGAVSFLNGQAGSIAVYPHAFLTPIEDEEGKDG